MMRIGNKIKEVLKERGLTVSEFARRINTSRENVYGIFRRQTIDTGLLLKINKVLRHDFFQYYSGDEPNVVKESSVVYKTPANKSNLLKMVATMKKELENCKAELELTRKEVDYLKKINELLENKKKK